MRTIAAITTSRADYSHLYWVLHELRDHAEIDLKLIVSGAHLSADFGETVAEIRRDGFTIDATVECLDDRDTDHGMARTIGQAMLGVSDVLADMRPDILLIIADRYEMLAPACAALALRIPIAHIEGGDISEGAIDDAVRNALTKMSHLHLTPTEDAKQRVIGMGEEPWRVHFAGAPSLDHLVRSTLPDRDSLQSHLGCSVTDSAIVVAYHPVTIAKDTLREADAVFDALQRLDHQTFFCFPNADAGGRKLIQRARAFCDAGDDRHLLVNLNPIFYWSLLKHAALMIGNSSSGIMETPSLALPTINIGFRQQGRTRARNIIDVEANADAIVDAAQTALSSAFLESLHGMTNPYGDGHAAQRITNVLVAAKLGEELLHKQPV
ncbi:MAG: UDP-N-acetylglucosamine 2-epimerase [Pseudomonadota bacterium]